MPCTLLAQHELQRMPCIGNILNDIEYVIIHDGYEVVDCVVNSAVACFCCVVQSWVFTTAIEGTLMELMAVVKCTFRLMPDHTCNPLPHLPM